MGSGDNYYFFAFFQNTLCLPTHTLHAVQNLQRLRDVVDGAVVLLLVEVDAVKGAGLRELRVFQPAPDVFGVDDVLVHLHGAEVLLKSDEIA